MSRSPSRWCATVGVAVFAGLASSFIVAPAVAADSPATASQSDTAGSPPYPRSTVPANGKPIHFKKTVLDTKFRGEGVAVGDFNHDGKLDIAAGNVYYAAPDWKMHVIYGTAPKDFDPHGYSDEFIAFADDVNHDGWTDYIVIGFPGTAAYWYENPKGAPGPWKQHLIGPVASTESPQYLDIDGNGHKALLMAVSEGQMAIVRPDPSDPNKPWINEAVSVKHAPGTDRFSHGIGAGSIRNNGRNDVLIPAGWWESPADKSEHPWKFHKADFGNVAAQMYVFDFNGDGLNDVLTSSPHDYGIWWHEQLKDGGWKTHEIDKTFSQSHSLVLADLTGDGLPGFVTGKRWWAHGPNGDKGAGEPQVLYWYELQRHDGKAEFVRHEIDNHSGVGTQFQVIDINGDGLLDIVIANKAGVFLFEQYRD
ncbi:MAG TPA: FG-GAP-like repeat-containing protein [Pirellulales bacterium]|jgi:hypothetical protein|nr:FG-GAP-like repeat-containing protein [Pirellulales bacterium]